MLSVDSTSRDEVFRPTRVKTFASFWKLLQKGQLFITDTTDTIQGHYRTENCTKQEAPPENKRPTKAQVPRSRKGVGLALVPDRRLVAVTAELPTR